MITAKTLMAAFERLKGTDEMPDDAVYFARWADARKFCELVEELQRGSGRSIEDVLEACNRNKADIEKSSMFGGWALEVLIKNFGKKSGGK